MKRAKKSKKARKSFRVWWRQRSARIKSDDSGKSNEKKLERVLYFRVYRSVFGSVTMSRFQIHTKVVLIKMETFSHTSKLCSFYSHYSLLKALKRRVSFHRKHTHTESEQEGRCAVRIHIERCFISARHNVECVRSGTL